MLLGSPCHLCSSIRAFRDVNTSTLGKGSSGCNFILNMELKSEYEVVVR